MPLDMTLFLDVEGILVPSMGCASLHPDAHYVLSDARKRFRDVCAWTTLPAIDAQVVLSACRINHYFSHIIGGMAIYSLSNGVMRGNGTLPLGDGFKDLAVLPGTPDEYLLIEDKDTAGYPESRIIRMNSFTEDHVSNLRAAYHWATLLAEGQLEERF